MEYLVLGCKIQCPQCGLPVTLNGPWEVAHCDSCQSNIDIPHDFWINALKDCLNDFHTFAEGEGRNSTVFGYFQTSLLNGRLKPRCPDDKTDLDIDESATLPAKAFCTKCGKEFAVVAPPDWLTSALPAIKLMVGTDLEQSTVAPKSDVQGPVVFVCPQCGGTLQVDGKDRMLNCQYCHSNVYLPDDLWKRLHPIKTVQRWYLGLDVSQLPKSDDEEDDSSK
jgi:DNA-directed RNA polymerase subunit RPC12/RpoP